VSECDREASIVGTPWPTAGCCAMEKKNNSYAEVKLLNRGLRKVVDTTNFAEQVSFL
jgi:hypothetical protein